MTMTHKNLLFVLAILAVFGFFWAISGERMHQIPPDEDHIAVTDIAVCKGCHIPEGEILVSENHPPKFECFKCHKRKRSSSKE
jgi:hypothetical protein